MPLTSTHNGSMAQRECPKCGAGNAMRTVRMVGKKKALKKCRSCGWRGVIDYLTNKYTEYKEEA